jgi:hypothetical protein
LECLEKKVRKRGNIHCYQKARKIEGFLMTPDKIKELASDNVLTSAYLILAECEKLKVRLALELQAVRDDRKTQQKEFSEFMISLRETLDQIRAKHLIEAQLLNLIRPQEVGEDDKHIRNWGNGKKFKVTVS